MSALPAASAAVPAEIAKRIRTFREEETYPLPSAKQIDAAERVLAAQPCIGDLSRWSRRYARKIDFRRGHVDRHLVWFDFREAGSHGYRPGRKIGRLADLHGIDDAQFRLASGTYDLRTRKVSFDACGLNWPERGAGRTRRRR